MNKAAKRAIQWRKDLQDQGYRQKSFLLSPKALAALEKLKAREGSDLAAVEKALAQAVRGER